MATKNKEYRKTYCKEWQEENKEERNAKRREYQCNRKATDKLYKLKINTRSLINSYIKRHDFSKTTKTAILLGCSFDDLLLHLGPKPDVDYHLDHICPCAQAQNEDELLKLQHYTNLRWMEASANISKNDMWTSEGEELCRRLLGRDWIY